MPSCRTTKRPSTNASASRSRPCRSCGSSGSGWRGPSRPMPLTGKRGDLDDEQWLEWYRMTPQERWHESQKLWAFYLAVGGSLDPEPDSQSPFDSFVTHAISPVDGQRGIRVIRRGEV